MKDINKYLRSDSKESSMRLAFNKTINTSIFVAISTTLGAISGFILAIVLNKDLQTISLCIGALAGLSVAIIGSLNIPAFSGKSAQAKFELENKTEEVKKE
jgi:ABC-type sugar transport system permease subunit